MIICTRSVGPIWPAKGHSSSLPPAPLAPPAPINGRATAKLFGLSAALLAAFVFCLEPALAAEEPVDDQERATLDYLARRPADARRDCEEIITAHRYSLAHLDRPAARVFLNRTACDIALANYSVAQKTLTAIEKFLRSSHAAPGRLDSAGALLADCLLLKAEIAYRNNEIKVAGPLYRASLQEYTDRFGFDSASLAAPLEGMAICYRREGHLGRALSAERQVAEVDFVNMGLGSYRFTETLKFLIMLEELNGQGEQAVVVQDLMVSSLRADMAERLNKTYEDKAEKGEIDAGQLPLIKARINRIVLGRVSLDEAKTRVVKELKVPKELLERPAKKSVRIDFNTWISGRRQAEEPPTLVRINPLVPQKALVYCIHGLGLHGASFDAFALKMADLGFPVLMPDIRGFGGNAHHKGLDKLEPEESLRDIYRSLTSLRKLTPDLPVVLLGESMGGALALQAAANDQDLIAALVCSVPSGSRFGGFSDSMKVARGLLKGKNEIDVGKMIVHKATSDKDSQERWEADPQARLTMSPKELVKFQEFMDQNFKAARLVDKLPVLFLQGGQDGLVKPMGTAELYSTVASADKDLLVVGRQEHLIFEDENCPAWIAPAISDWLENKLRLSDNYKPE
ncbi:MAG: alpha/beta fold hydrolase [Cyanobacteria bacterium REEB67]|nr:alpha/beta fold hydrolase [Cyanobacteria bacterium REEB67]